MSYKHTCYLCGNCTSSCTPASQRKQLIQDVLGFTPKTYGEWGLCPTCVIGLTKGSAVWMEKYIPRGFVPFAWRNPPRVLMGGRKKRRRGSGRPATLGQDLDAVSLPLESSLIEEFHQLPSLNQHAKARLLKKVAEEQGVLHLLTQTTTSESTTKAVPGNSDTRRAKQYTSDLRLSQRKLEALAIGINREAGTRLFPTRREIRSSLATFKDKFHALGSYVVAKDPADFVCDFFGLPRSVSSTAASESIVLGMDHGGGSIKVVARPYGLSGGHGCLVLLHSGKDSRCAAEEIMKELGSLSQRFRVWFSGDNKQLQFLMGTAASACWQCGVVEKRVAGRHTYQLDASVNRWDNAVEWNKQYALKCSRLKRPPAHFNGQKFDPLVDRGSVLLPWLHILMGTCRNVFDHMIRNGARRGDLEAFLQSKLSITPTKPIAGSTLEKTNVLGYTGKDCKLVLDRIDELKNGFNDMPKGHEAFKVLESLQQVRLALMKPRSETRVELAINEFKSLYVDGGFNPSLVVHLLVAHGSELYATHSESGLRLLTEELVERIHSEINEIKNRSQLEGDLLSQISRWNWQYSTVEQECLSTPLPKRCRKPARQSPQLDLKGLSSSSGPSRAVERSDSEYVESE